MIKIRTVDFELKLITLLSRKRSQKLSFDWEFFGRVLIMGIYIK